MVRALALRSGDPRFKTRSDHSFEFVPGSPWVNFPVALGILNSCCYCSVLLFRCVSLALKAPMGSGLLSMYCIILYGLCL